MKKKSFEFKKIFFLLVLAFFLVFFSFSIYTVLSGIISFGELEKWDGESVANSFASGNGSKENPYVIHNAEQFMYFKSLVEGDEYRIYQDKYYELDSNIDFNGHAIKPIGIHVDGDEEYGVQLKNKESDNLLDDVAVINDRIFTGVLDGKGYALMNFRIEEASVTENTSYFALFSRIVNGEIYRLNLENYKIEIPESNDVVVSGLVGNIYNGVVENVALRDFNIKTKQYENVTVGLIAGKSDELVVKNVYLNGEVDDVNNGIVRYYDKGKDSTIISDVKHNGDIVTDNVNNLYLVQGGKFYLGGEEISANDLLNILNTELDSDYYWSFENERLSIITHALDEVAAVVPEEAETFSFSIQKSPDISLHASGTSGNSVYVNDLDADLNYYTGRNYTEITTTNGVIPNGTNRNLYSTGNLATVYIRYSSADINDSSTAGRISGDDNFTDFYYYKRYPVVGGYVEFDLIDNPWGYRPNNKAFNGWVTDYTGATVSLDMDTYVRHVRVPVTDVSSPISITFYASWTNATVVTTTGDLGNLKSVGMTALHPSVSDNLTDYYVVNHVNRYYYYPDSNYLYRINGQHIASGSYCNTSGGCDYLARNTNATYDPNTTYYSVTPIENSENVTVATVTPTISSPIGYYNSGSVAAGYFKRVTSGSDNIYSSTGEKLNSCNGTCYQLMQYSDGPLDSSTTYYYLTTRDTNIFVPSSNVNTSNISTSKPMTITAINNGNDNSDTRTVQLNNNWTIDSDLKVEYIRFYTNSTDENVDNFNSGNGYYKIIGNFYNLKLGRGLTRYGDYLTATSFVGGNSTTTYDLEKYTTIVESGYYQNGSGVGYNSAHTHYVNAKVTLGSDYDRVRTNGNDNLYVYYCYAGSWASYLYNSTSGVDTYDTPSVYTVVKSGNYGTNEADYAAGIYTGGRGAGSHYSLREVKVEGGYIFNLIGGPVSSDNRSGKNDIIINVTGGTINMIFGGAGVSNTTGSRILNITGGTINYSILGGSNAYTQGNGSNPYGKIDGDTLVYVGGNVTVGTKNDSIYNITSGNVFGAGNGRENELDVGSVNNSNVIIGPSANIKGSVFGGGNYGAVGGNIVGTSTYNGSGSSSGEENPNSLMEDGTADNNIRYYGTSPDNYISFNGENYRIIGLFNNVATPNGNKDLVRIVKNTSYNNSTVWNNTYISNGNSRTYSNYWLRSDNNANSYIRNILNTTFYNSINATYRNYIQTATWRMGATTNANRGAASFYTAEHGNTAGSDYSVTSDQFNIGLFYASDYGFASEQSCLDTNVSNYSNNCRNWMSSMINNDAWTLSPSTEYNNISNSTRRRYNNYNIFYLNTNDNIDNIGMAYRSGNNYYYQTNAVYPSFYLKDDITISGGDGSSSNPYIIGDSDTLLTDLIDELAHPHQDDPIDDGEYVPIDDTPYQEGTDYQARTHIHVIGGTIDGSIYGAGNNNGSGNRNDGSHVANSKITIDIDAGNIKESVYGGSNEKGTVYGDIVINANNGTIDGSIYGGGKGGGSNGTYVSRNIDVNIGTASTTNLAIRGSVYGGSAFGTVNGIAQGEDPNNSYVRVNVNNGVITGSVFGGGEGNNNFMPYEYGNVFVHINDGNMTSVFGGNDSAGQPSNASVVYLTGGTIGDAFGGGNNTGQKYTDIRLQGSTITGNLYGGSNQSGNVTSSHVTVTDGTVTNVYGGNNLDGKTLSTNVLYNNGSVKADIYGGGNQAESDNTNVLIYGGVLNNVFGGGNQAGVTNNTNVTVLSGTINELYGGSNESGTVGSTNINVVDSYDDRRINDSVQSNLILDDQGQTWTDQNMRYIKITPKIENTSDVDYTEWTAKITVPGSSIFYGFNYLITDVIEDNGTYTFTHVNKYDPNNPIVLHANSITEIPDYFAIQVPIDIPYELKFELSVTDNLGGREYFIDNYVDGIKVEDLNKGINYIYGGNNKGGSTGTSNVNITAGTIGEVYGGGNKAGVTTTNVNANGGNIVSVFGGSNTTGNVTTSNVNIGASTPADVTVTDVYGGNNAGGVTTQANVNMTAGTVTNIFGGGNNANVGSTHVTVDGGSITDVFGGGNAASVQQNTVVNMNAGTLTGSLYGGGNEGTVQGNTNVKISGGTVGENAYAGGNGAAAVVNGNSTITIDGNTVIGSSSTEAPSGGCVFGSGNAASTGSNGGSSKATVNIVGGEIYGNVYGGPKMSVVYGTTETNIGTHAVNDNNLVEGDIRIHGTVFGGGESNASGSESYDYTFISVTDGITVNIDGSGYDSNNHDFVINGSIFGSGNASSSSGESNINIKSLGSMSKPNKAISIQRANNLIIDNSVIELEGTTDRTNDYSDIEYSFNLIDKLIIKNDTTLFLQHNANMLKELYSGVDSGGSLVKAAVDIDDDTKTVTKNVDNRIYMYPGENLNIAVNPSATAYGKVNGMTFFGMYTSSEGVYRLGLYDPTYSYGDTGSAGLEIVGGSYVMGLKYDNHDITVDGFYTNILDEENYTDIVTQYIDPTPIGTQGYRWAVGFEAINYTVDLTLSKYSSLGTAELSMIDFAQGNSVFTILSVDTTGLKEGVQLVDSNNVPRIADTEEEANSTIGLSMKIETQEWTSFGTTKFLSIDGGKYTGGDEYTTDSRKVAPSAMFYAYHAKNYTDEGDLGEVIITVQVAIPKNAIDYELKFVTITVNLEAHNYDDGAYYDASITYNKKYELPARTDVNITHKSQFTTYFSLTEYFDKYATAYGINNEYYHVITFTKPLPVGTIITILDFGTNDTRPEYYYYTITQQVYDASVQEYNSTNPHLVSYRLSNFIKMDSTSPNNTYDDAAANLLYYDADTNMVDEEFIFIIDMKDSNETGMSLNNRASFELRNSDGWPIINVVGARETLMTYSLYDSSNVVLSQTFDDVDSYLYYNVPDTFQYSTAILYNQTDNKQSVIDTNYEFSSMGLNVAFYDRSGEMVSSSLLVGTSLSIGNHEYFTDGDGIIRIKLANKVSNIDKTAKLVIGPNLPAGTYTVRYTLFASEDGLHNSTYQNSVHDDFTINVVSSASYISAECEDGAKLVYGETGLNNDGDEVNSYTIKYVSELSNPNFRVEVYKRSVEMVNSTNYESVPFNTLFKNTLTVVSGNEVRLPVTDDDEQTFDFELADNLTSGTYRVVFKLYDNNQLIDEDIKNVIVQKKIT